MRYHIAQLGLATILLGATTTLYTGTTRPFGPRPQSRRFAVTASHREPKHEKDRSVVPSPEVTVTPSYKMLIGTNSVTVGIYWCIPGGDYLSTYRLLLNATDVTSQFSDDSYGLQPPPHCQGPNDWWAHWSGTIAV